MNKQTPEQSCLAIGYDAKAAAEWLAVSRATPLPAHTVHMGNQNTGMSLFRVNTGLLTEGIEQPDFVGFIPLPPQRSAIMSITTDELDHLLAPYMRFGMLRTEYNRITGATEYRGQSGGLIAMTVGKRHFCRRISGPMSSISLHMQQVGRIKRQQPPVQWHLDPRSV